VSSLDEGGAVVMGNVISSEAAGYTVMVLAKMVEEFAGTPLETMALNALNAQTQYLIDNLFVPGGFKTSYEIGVGVNDGPLTVEASAAALRGIYAAGELTGSIDYLGFADVAYTVFVENFYVPEEMVFKTVMGNNIQATYTPYNVALITGVLRSANLGGGHDDAPAIFTRFFKIVGNGMQLCEAPPSGETGNDSDGDGVPFIMDQPDDLPMVFASEAVYDFAVGIREYQDGSKILQLSNNPNPADDYTRINFNLDESSKVKIEIIDINGRKVDEILNQNRPAGQNRIEWNTSSLQAGTYFYRVTTDRVSAIGKVSVL